MSEMLNYALKELTDARKGLTEEELDIQANIDNCVVSLLNLFNRQGHSGETGGYVLARFCRLANFLPLSPLTGEDDEWELILSTPDGIKEYRNKRCSRISKNENGTAYDDGGYTFTNDMGQSWYSTPESRKRISFPYRVPGRPTRVYLKPGQTPEDWSKLKMGARTRQTNAANVRRDIAREEKDLVTKAAQDIESTHTTMAAAFSKAMKEKEGK